MGKRTSNEGTRGAASDSGHQIRARAWRFVFDCHEKRKVATSKTDQKAREDSDDRSQNGTPA